MAPTMNHNDLVVIALFMRDLIVQLDHDENGYLKVDVSSGSYELQLVYWLGSMLL